jgi:hypothetical protein
MKYIDQVSDDEMHLLEEAFSWILLLLATTREKLGQIEYMEASHTIKVRGYEENHMFHRFYDIVNRKFETSVHSWMGRIGVSKSAATEYEKLLAHVNPVLAKMPHPVARQLYKDYISYAHRIANASGGILGFMKISKAEAELMKLSMITPINALAGEALEEE